MNELSEFSNLCINPRKERLAKFHIPKMENIPLENFANSIIPSDLANFELSDYTKFPKMSKKNSGAQINSDDESICSVRIQDRIDVVPAEIKQLRKPGTMTYDDRKQEWGPYKPPAKDWKRLADLDQELMLLHDQQEEARTKYQKAIPSEPMEIGEEVFVRDFIAHAF